jgi:catechol 2,3-dioxygenase-like lactoylglutathione lyase family enzyme
MKRFALILTIASLCLPLAAQDQSARPKITGIAHVRVYVASIDKSREFYTKIVGLPGGGGGCAGVSRPCFPVNVLPAQQIELEHVPSPAPKNWLAEVAFATDDVAQMRRYLLAHGVTVGAISKDSNGAQHFELHDPEGNPIAFIQRLPEAINYITSSNQVSTRLFHAGFVVKDRTVEDRFYLDLLGFRMYWHGGMKDTDNDWVEIQVPDGSDWIEYMLNILPTADHDELGVMNHLALGVVSMNPAFERLRAHGLQTTEAPEIGRDGKWQFDIFDPDGTRVEFMEFKPAQKPCCHPYEAAHPTP